MRKRTRRLTSAVLSLALLAQAPVVMNLSLPVLAVEAADVLGEKTFDGTAESRFEITDLMPSNECDTMIWKGDFKIESGNDAVIMALASVCGLDDANDYLTLYIKPKTNKIGFEFRQKSGVDSEIKIDNSADFTSNDGEWHSWQLTVFPRGYFLSVDGSQLIEDTSSRILTSMNCFANKKMFLGGMDRKTSNPSNWYFTGSMKNISILGENSQKAPESFASMRGASFDGTTRKEKAFTIPEGGWQNVSIGIQFSLADLDSDQLLAAIEMDGGSLTITLEPDGTLVLSNGSWFARWSFEPEDFVVDSWNTLHLSHDGSVITAVLDDQTPQYANWAAPIAGTAGSARLVLGQSGQSSFRGKVTKAEIYDGELSEEVMTSLGEFTSLPALSGKRTSEIALFSPGYYESGFYRIPGLVKTNKGTLIAASDRRVDTQSDFNNIDTIIRRKEAGKDWEEGQVILDMLQRDDIDGKDCTLIDPSVMNVTMPDGSNRIYLLVDFFPQSPRALMWNSYINESTGHVPVTLDCSYLSLLIRKVESLDLDAYTPESKAALEDGLKEARSARKHKLSQEAIDEATRTLHQTLLEATLAANPEQLEEIDQHNPIEFEEDTVIRQVLELKDNSGFSYTVRDDGKIYDSSEIDTGARMEIAGDPATGYHDNGTLTGPDGEDWGNAYMTEGPDTGHLHVTLTQYLVLTHSDDDGKTWSAPVNISGQVKQSWMKFLGTGPGQGIQLENGHLMFPVYSTHHDVGQSQASAVIVSEDYGETWTLKNSPILASGVDRSKDNFGSDILTESQAVQLDDGRVALFMRNQSRKVKVSFTDDEGETWTEPEQTPVHDAYCQVSALHTHYKGKEYIILSNPSGPDNRRQNGVTTVGEVKDGTIEWKPSKLYRAKDTLYSCLEEIEEGRIGLLFEGTDENTEVNNNGNINQYYVEFDMDYLLGEESTTQPRVSSVDTELTRGEGRDACKIGAGDTFTFTVHIDQPIFVSGTPSLAITLGADEEKVERQAEYVSDNGSNTFTFRYTLQESDPQGDVRVENVIRNEEGEPAVNYYGLNMYSRFFSPVAVIGNDWTVGTRDVENVSVIANAGHTDWGAKENAVDKNNSTIWHSNNLENGWLTFDLGEETLIDAVRYLPRQDSSNNGNVTACKIYAGNDPDNLVEVGSAEWTMNKNWRGVEFTPVRARYVKFVGTEAYSDQAAQGNFFVSAAEIAIRKAQ